MENLQQLFISMKYDAYCSSEKLLNSISIINAINVKKHEICDSHTTEVIDGISAHVMEMVSKVLELPILLPSGAYKMPRITYRFKWGTIILLQQEAYN